MLLSHSSYTTAYAEIFEEEKSTRSHFGPFTNKHNIQPKLETTPLVFNKDEDFIDMSLLSKTDTHRLHNRDMKKLVRIFQRIPFSTSGNKEGYQKTNEDIRNLPRHLRSLLFGISSSNLCSMHTGLNAHLINDLWAWLRYELDGGIGKFIYPLIMSQALTGMQEFCVRQLEPVRRMWDKAFQVETSAPPGCESIRRSHWGYQQDQCPACMLARIGSDADVLFAIFAGMVGRMTSKASGTEEWQGPMTFENIRSKRLRFVRYWIKATSGGDTAVYQAGELGVTMKHLTQAWKAEQRRVRSTQKFFVDTTRHDTKLGPVPRPSDVPLLSPVAPLGFNVNMSPFSDNSPIAPSQQSQHYTPRHIRHLDSHTTVPLDDNILSAGRLSLTPAMVEALEHDSKSQSNLKPPTHIRRDSIFSAQPKMLQRSISSVNSGRASILSMASSKTISSYDGGNKSLSCAPVNDQSDGSFYEILTQQELLDKYRSKLTQYGDNYDEQKRHISALQVSRLTSMYSSYSDETFEEDPFEATDKFSDDETEATDKGDWIGKLERLTMRPRM